MSRNTKKQIADLLIMKGTTLETRLVLPSFETVKSSKNTKHKKIAEKAIALSSNKCGLGKTFNPHGKLSLIHI